MESGTAIPFITKEGKDYEVTEEAKQFLSSITEPVAIIAVCGKYRTGKSYLLNHCLLDLGPGEGFGVGPTINPCTKGLWIWSNVIDSCNAEGEKMRVLLIDSEGLGAFDED
jgi:hypothetical protein